MAKKSKSRGRYRNTRRKTTARRSLRFYKPVRRPVPRASVTPHRWKGEEVRSTPVKKTAPSRHTRTARTNKLQKAAKVSLTKQEHKRKLICARRAIRNEVIHAKGHAGKSGQKRPNLKNRNIKCHY